MTLVLASTSAIRRHMLEAAGVDHDALAPQVDEDELKLGLVQASDIALRLARRKR